MHSGLRAQMGSVRFFASSAPLLDRRDCWRLQPVRFHNEFRELQIVLAPAPRRHRKFLLSTRRLCCVMNTQRFPDVPLEAACEDDQNEGMCNSYWILTSKALFASELLELIEGKSLDLNPGAYGPATEDNVLRDEMIFSMTTTLQPIPPKIQEQKSCESNDYYVNVGYAIRTLRDELPFMFISEMTYDIYRDDIVFCDPHNNTFGSLDSYKFIFSSLRFHGSLFFKSLLMNVVRVWQPSDNVIMVRWTVHGILRAPWEAQVQFDGISEYKLDKKGKIYEHRVENALMNKLPKYSSFAVMDLSMLAVNHIASTLSLHFRENKL